MNEFIVWDKVGGNFLKILKIDYKLKLLWLDETLDGTCERFFHEVIFLKDIGKTDINDKKIFSDSSIVEFEVFCSANQELQKRKGYFSYNHNRFCYEVFSFSSRDYKRIFVGGRDVMNNFKIIDTIQKNKLGLIK